MIEYIGWLRNYTSKTNEARLPRFMLSVYESYIYEPNYVIHHLVTTHEINHIMKFSYLLDPNTRLDLQKILIRYKDNTFISSGHFLIREAIEHNRIVYPKPTKNPMRNHSTIHNPPNNYRIPNFD